MQRWRAPHVMLKNRMCEVANARGRILKPIHPLDLCLHGGRRLETRATDRLQSTLRGLRAAAVFG